MKCDAVFSSYTNEIYIYSLITFVRHFSSVGLYYEILILSTVFFSLDIPQNNTFEDKGFCWLVKFFPF